MEGVLISKRHLTSPRSHLRSPSPHPRPRPPHSVPFDGFTPVEAAFAVAKHGKRPLLPHDAPPALAHIINECWAQDAELRPSFRELCTTLADEAKRAANDKLLTSMSLDKALNAATLAVFVGTSDVCSEATATEAEA